MDQAEKLRKKILLAFKQVSMRPSDIEIVYNRGLDVEVSFKKIGLGEKPKPITIEFSNVDEATQGESIINTLKSGDAGFGVDDPNPNTVNEVTSPAPEPLGI